MLAAEFAQPTYFRFEEIRLHYWNSDGNVSSPDDLLGNGIIEIPGRLDAISDQISDAIYVFRYCSTVWFRCNHPKERGPVHAPVLGGRQAPALTKMGGRWAENGRKWAENGRKLAELDFQRVIAGACCKPTGI